MDDSRSCLSLGSKWWMWASHSARRYILKASIDPHIYRVTLHQWQVPNSLVREPHTVLQAKWVNSSEQYDYNYHLDAPPFFLYVLVNAGRRGGCCSRGSGVIEVGCTLRTVCIWVVTWSGWLWNGIRTLLTNNFLGESIGWAIFLNGLNTIVVTRFVSMIFQS